MDGADLIAGYFPDLTAEQRDCFGRLGVLYEDWNAKINVISRKDIGELYLHHVLHSLAIAKVIRFVPGTRVMDVGTGGGFPGIPLAILFPQCDFYLVDSIGKKVKVVREVAGALGLANVRAEQVRAEEVKERFDFVVSRAVTAMPTFVGWVRGEIGHESHNELPNGVLCLKGGDFEEEIQPFRQTVKLFDIQDFFPNPYFEGKKVVYLEI